MRWSYLFKVELRFELGSLGCLGIWGVSFRIIRIVGLEFRREVRGF